MSVPARVWFFGSSTTLGWMEIPDGGVGRVILAPSAWETVEPLPSDGTPEREWVDLGGEG